ncbi:rhamnan synthesis F family protein [Azospirillum sp. ST 5-10]|uniref:rhamnan synthesis F family protein n=1 Tax=unclassified Azospirillum TaxID=2630922 RepID=UPI003F4A09F3
MQIPLGVNVVRFLSQAVFRVLTWMRIAASYALYWSSFFRSSSHVVARHAGAAGLKEARRVAVFVHYDRHGVVDDYVFYYLRSIVDAGFRIVLVSNSRAIRLPDLERLKSLCALILVRDNVGLDFAAYKDGIAAIPDLRSLDALILANDSVYGPIHDLGRMIEKMDSGVADVWGATDSWEISFHLQSYFLLLHHKALASESFAAFWRTVRCVQSKTWAVRRYEVGLTRHLQRGGFRCRALFRYREIATRITDTVLDQRLLDDDNLDHARKAYLGRVLSCLLSGIPLNGSHYFWDVMIANMEFPFIKRDLLHKNPVRIPFLGHWELLVRQNSAYDPDLILRHLERSLKNRSV